MVLPPNKASPISPYKQINIRDGPFFMNAKKREARHCHKNRQRHGDVRDKQYRESKRFFPNASRARPVVCPETKNHVTRMGIGLCRFLPGYNKPSRCSEPMILKMPPSDYERVESTVNIQRTERCGEACLSASYLETVDVSRCNFRPMVCHRRHVSIPAAA